jgi:transcriptional regulator with XRE-family HTH domain
MDEVRRRIGARIRECRKEAGLSQEDLAREMGVKRQAVSQWENAKTMPHCGEWYRLGPLLGVSLDYLVYGVKTIPVSDSGILAAIFRREGEEMPTQF